MLQSSAGGLGGASQPVGGNGHHFRSGSAGSGITPSFFSHCFDVNYVAMLLLSSVCLENRRLNSCCTDEAKVRDRGKLPSVNLFYLSVISKDYEEAEVLQLLVLIDMYSISHNQHSAVPETLAVISMYALMVFKVFQKLFTALYNY
jgi:hypothetical protein